MTIIDIYDARDRAAKLIAANNPPAVRKFLQGEDLQALQTVFRKNIFGGIYVRMLDDLLGRAYASPSTGPDDAHRRLAIAHMIYNKRGRLRAGRDIVMAYRHFGLAVRGPRDRARNDIAWDDAARALTLHAHPDLAAHYADRQPELFDMPPEKIVAALAKLNDDKKIGATADDLYKLGLTKRTDHAMTWLNAYNNPAFQNPPEAVRRIIRAGLETLTPEVAVKAPSTPLRLHRADRQPDVWVCDRV